MNSGEECVGWKSSNAFGMGVKSVKSVVIHDLTNGYLKHGLNESIFAPSSLLSLSNVWSIYPTN